MEWHTNLNGHVLSSPTVVGNFVYVGSSNHQVIAVNRSTGDPVWATTTGDIVQASPTVVKGVVYVGSRDGYLYGLNAGNGLVKWHKLYDTTMPTPGVFYAAAYVNGILYFSEGNYVRAVKASNGAKVWSYKLHFGPTGYNPSGVAVADGSVYFGCTCGTVTALNATTGAQEWQKFIVSANQPLTVANGVVFLPEQSGPTLRGLDATNGDILFTATEGTPLTGSDAWTAPAISDGVVYAGATDGLLYAFKP
jgi:outer membrane protein assembly factor BamB